MATHRKLATTHVQWHTSSYLYVKIDNVSSHSNNQVIIFTIFEVSYIDFSFPAAFLIVLVVFSTMNQNWAETLSDIVN